jgi:hypothetical protein
MALFECDGVVRNEKRRIRQRLYTLSLTSNLCTMKLTALFLVPSLVHAFVPVVPRPAEKTTARLAAKSSTGGGSQHQGSDSTSSIQEPHFSSSWMLPLVSTAAAACLTLTAAPAWAVSGGGLDFAGTDISGQIFSNGNYKGKDFTQGTSR